MSWIPNVQGLRTFRSFLGTVFQQRSTLRVGGLPLSDNGTETVLNGVQSLAGAGTWDGVSGLVLVNGSGARLIAIPDPTDPSPGTTVRFIDAVGNAGSGTITLDPSGAGTIAGVATKTITTNGTSQALVWISVGKWQLG